MSRDIFQRRIQRVRERLREEGIDAFLVAVPENRYYLSGFEADDLLFTESSGYLLITEQTNYLLTDFRYEEEAKTEAPDFNVIIYRNGFPEALAGLGADLAVRRLGVEGHYLTVKLYGDIEKALRESRDEAEIISLTDAVEKLRVVKEPEEIERIRASLALTEEALQAVWEGLRPGKRERDVAWEIERRIREGGGEAVSFPPIVAAGPNGALPHAVPTDRLIGEGESVILDLGSRLHHYCSDMTRTWVAGEPHPKLREIYSVVREAQAAAQAVVRAGEETAVVDAVARDFIGDAGYGDYFGHGLGHGVGLAVHELPGLRKTKGTILEENMIVTVEPGIYLPGFGGVRLENMVRVTATGCEVLNGVDLMYRWTP